jgi:outer membrane biosynthesis protein TonB
LIIDSLCEKKQNKKTKKKTKTKTKQKQNKTETKQNLKKKKQKQNKTNQAEKKIKQKQKPNKTKREKGINNIKSTQNVKLTITNRTGKAYCFIMCSTYLKGDTMEFRFSVLKYWKTQLVYFSLLLLAN